MLKSVIVAALSVIPGSVRAQTVESYMAMADSQMAAKRFIEALRLFEQAMTLDSLAYDATAKASLIAVTLGEFHPDPQARASLYARHALCASRHHEPRR